MKCRRQMRRNKVDPVNVKGVRKNDNGQRIWWLIILMWWSIVKNILRCTAQYRQSQLVMRINRKYVVHWRRPIDNRMIDKKKLETRAIQSNEKLANRICFLNGISCVRKVVHMEKFESFIVQLDRSSPVSTKEWRDEWVVDFLRVGQRTRGSGKKLT